MLAAGARVNEAADRSNLAGRVRQAAAAKKPMTLLVEVREQSGSWSMRVPEISGVEARAGRRQDIEPASRAAIAAALEVPYHYFEVHIRFLG
jgi:hypothetical protein